MSFDLKLQSGSLVIDTSGDLAIVDKVDKLIQDIIKIIITPLGADKSNPWYGSNFSKIIGNVMDTNFASSLSSSQLKSALDNLKKMQEIQSKVQYMSPEEQIAAIRNTSVKQNSVDPRFYLIMAQVVNKAFQNVPVNTELQAF